MEILLQEKVRNLGNIGELVSVKSGYARNFLLPLGKAVLATPENKAFFEARRVELETLAAKTLQEAQARASTLEQLKITIAARAGEEGKLFGSIGTQALAKAISDAGTVVQKNEVQLPNGALRQLGDYEVLLQLHSDVSVMVKVSVVPEA